jgi:hypothetical protein
VERKSKKFRAYVLALSILLAFLLAYPQYSSPAAPFFLTADLALESLRYTDPGDLSTDLTDQPEKIVLAFRIYSSHPGTHSFADFFLLHFPPISLEKRILILRC